MIKDVEDRAYDDPHTLGGKESGPMIRRELRRNMCAGLVVPAEAAAQAPVLLLHWLHCCCTAAASSCKTFFRLRYEMMCEVARDDKISLNGHVLTSSLFNVENRGSRPYEAMVDERLIEPLVKILILLCKKVDPSQD